MGSSTAANAAGFQDAGKPLAEPVYLVDANGNPISSTNALNVNASFSASSVAINDPNTTSQKMAVDASGNASVKLASGSTTAVTQATGSNLHAVLDSGSTTTVTQATASNLNAQVVGAAASGASNAGNPVKGGGVFNATQPTVTNGQAVDAQYTARGAAIVATGVDALNVNNVSGTVSLPTGAATSAKQPALGTAGSASSDVITVQGIASMTALTVSGTVTSNAGTNLNTSALALESGGNLATLAGGVSSSKYQVNHAQVAGTSVSVNQGTVDGGTQRFVQGGASTGTKSSVASSASSVTILASNTSRKGAMVYNDSTAILYLDLSGGTASNSSYSLQIPANGFFELPGPTVYNGAITGIWSAAQGNARVTEFS